MSSLPRAGFSSLWYTGFSLWWFFLLWSMGSRVLAQWSWHTGSLVLKHAENPRPGIEPKSPALAGRFFIMEPLGKPWAPPFEGRSIKECVDFCHTESESLSVVSDSLPPHGLHSPWKSPGQNTGVGGLSFYHGVFETRDWTQTSSIAGGFFTSWATREAQNTGVGSPSLLQQIFPTQESKWGLLHCKRILYQLSYKGSHFS